MNRKLLIFGIVAITLAAWGQFEWMAYLKREQARLPDPLFAQRSFPIPAPTAKEWGFLGSSFVASLPIDPIAAAKQARPSLARTYQFAESEVRRIAQGWPTQADSRFPASGFSTANSWNWYIGRWAAGPQPATETQPALTQHSLTLEVLLHHPSTKLEKFRLTSRYEPVDCWGVEWTVMFSEDNPQVQLISWQALPPRGWNAAGTTDQAPQMGAVKWDAYIHPKDFTNDRRIELHWPHQHKSFPVPHREDPNHLRRIWESLEAFQATALEELELFDRFVKDWNSRGARVSIFTPPFVGGNPPEKGTAPADYRAEVLALAAEHTQLRREILYEHTDELHLAMRESFPPIKELFELLQTPSK
jgi:hypothetical protein